MHIPNLKNIISNIEQGFVIFLKISILISTVQSFYSKSLACVWEPKILIFTDAFLTILFKIIV